MSQNTTNITVVAEAKEAAAQIYKILDTPSSNDERTKPETCVGRIQAVGVNFTYPSRPDVQILNDYNVNFEPRQAVAFLRRSEWNRQEHAHFSA
ncbi:hypothetical protein DVH05_021876 [Phytophthora capsici]|nr:hypothetical protein DVH05_021876 [Phytophthora capsici]